MTLRPTETTRRPVRTEHHAFVDGDTGRCGAILRHIEPRRLHTRTVFRMGEDAPVYLVDHVVEHDGDVRQWRRFAYDCPTSGSRHTGTRDRAGAVRIDGRPAPRLTGALGGYGEHLLVDQLLRDESAAASYRQFDEGEPELDVQAAELRRSGVEPTLLLDGSTVAAERIDLVVDGRGGNTHWCVGTVVVKSDWRGAQSFLVPDLDAICSGLDHEVVTRIREFTAT